MLQRQQGAAIAAIMKTTGRQQHSVRGFLAGVLRAHRRMGFLAALDCACKIRALFGRALANAIS